MRIEAQRCRAVGFTEGRGIKTVHALATNCHAESRGCFTDSAEALWGRQVLGDWEGVR